MADSWTEETMPDQAGRTVIVTGANTGLGYEAAAALARGGAYVVVACRSEERGRAARERIEDDVEGASLAVMELDLADLSSVRSFARRFRRDNRELHVLCNNAGVMAIPRRETADGFETQFGVNHLGHFALTGLLLDRLRETPGETRVVTQSSYYHRRGRIDFPDLDGERSYDKWAAYAQSKLANVLFAAEFDRRLRAANASVESVACHPGYAATDLQRRGPEMEGSWLRLRAMSLANALFAQSAERGALPMLFAATEPEVDGGEYVGPGGFLNARGPPEVQDPSARSRDEELARRLWKLSVERTGVTFDLPEPTH